MRESRKEITFHPTMTEPASQWQVNTWDFTFWFQGNNKWTNPTDYMNALRERCSKWAFQLEKSEEGQLHLQGRIRLRQKMRLAGVKAAFQDIMPGAHWSVTSAGNAHSNHFNYCVKLHTRVEGPWTDKMEEAPVKQHEVDLLDEKGLLPWQEYIVEDCRRQNEVKTRDGRSVNVLVDKKGHVGKGALMAWMEYKGFIEVLPGYLETAEKVIGYCIDRPSIAYAFDLPRSLAKTKMNQLYTAIESIKDGRLIDPRFKGRKRIIQRPALWIFTNKAPRSRYLSADRWKLWMINEEQELVPYTKV